MEPKIVPNSNSSILGARHEEEGISSVILEKLEDQKKMTAPKKTLNICPD